MALQSLGGLPPLATLPPHIGEASAGALPVSLTPSMLGTQTPSVTPRTESNARLDDAIKQLSLRETIALV
eukprot:2670512-Amphidinium_carterae.1